MLLGVTYGYTEVDQNPYSKLVMEEAWKQEITYDWDNLDHAAAFANWKQEFGKVYADTEVPIHSDIYIHILCVFVSVSSVFSFDSVHFVVV